jgi:hypothetical protein
VNQSAAFDLEPELLIPNSPELHLHPAAGRFEEGIFH